VKKLNSAIIFGSEALKVSVEVAFSKGLPGFSIVGLGSNSVLEARDRIKAALCANDFTFPPKKIVINLSPSDTPKTGTLLELPMALGIALYEKSVDFSDYMIFGELGLDGKLRGGSGLFSILLSLAKKGVIKKCIIPKEEADKLSIIPEVEFFAFENIKECIEFFTAETKKEPHPTSSITSKSFNIEGEEFFYEDSFSEDFKDVRGQEIAKRGALIAACGFHNILMEGSPGSGKSMIARRLRHILPPLKKSEILEIAALGLLDGKDIDFKAIRPFYAPHCSSTKSSILGGGTKEAKPGVLALGNNGLIFFDEFPNFSKDIIESLREPLEDNKLLISRVNSKIEYKTEFIFVAAQNPCPCGNLFSTTKECRCSDIEINRYKGKISEPIMDRIDLYIKMDEVKGEDRPSKSSKEMLDVVVDAFKFRLQRGQSIHNGKLDKSSIERFCILDKDAENLLTTGVSRFSLSFRSIDKIKKVARTIADMERSETIKKGHLLEALGFRKR